NSMSLSAWPPVVKPGRKSRSRVSLFCLTSLILLAVYVFVVQRSTLTASFALVPHGSDSTSRHHPDADPVPAIEALEHSRLRFEAHRKLMVSRPQINLTPEQELAAVSGFLASLPQNIIPPSVDPSVPIDPQLVLDFDTRGARAKEEVDVMTELVWAHNPVFLYSKLYSPLSREIKSYLHSLNLVPSPTIIDIDVRDDAEVLKPLVQRLTSSTDLPVLLVGGQSMGSMADIRDMVESGELKQRILDAGAVVGKPKKKK
ncbi:hypothetical protein K435DRAFT_559179, partial [Dendrothele bispora CBS 962.96]